MTFKTRCKADSNEFHNETTLTKKEGLYIADRSTCSKLGFRENREESIIVVPLLKYSVTQNDLLPRAPALKHGP